MGYGFSIRILMTIKLLSASLLGKLGIITDKFCRFRMKIQTRGVQFENHSQPLLKRCTVGERSLTVQQ